MDKLDPELREQLKQPRRQVNVIVRLRSGAGDRSADFQALDCEIRRRFWLTRSYSITCTASKALKLSQLDWVDRVELDRTVKALDSKPAQPTRR